MAGPSRRAERVALIGLVLNAPRLRPRAADAVDEINLVVMTTRHLQPAQPGHDDRAGRAHGRGDRAARDAAGLPPTVTLSATFGCPFEGEVAPARVVDARRAACRRPASTRSRWPTRSASPCRRRPRRVGAVRAVTGGIPLRRTSTTPATPATPTRSRPRVGRRRSSTRASAVSADARSPRGHRQHRDRGPRLPPRRSGVDTGFDLDALIGASEWLGERLGRPTPALVSKAGGSRPESAPDEFCGSSCKFAQRPLRWSLAGPLPVGIELGSHGRHPNERQALHRAGRGRGPSRRRLHCGDRAPGPA